MFDAIMALHEDFREVIEAFRTKPESLSKFLREVSDYMLDLPAYTHSFVRILTHLVS
jgi:hypothetical protein